MTWLILLAALALLALAALALHDVLQPRHAVLRIYPVLGHFRYWIESIGPELRQYIVANNNEERPFSRDQRRWVYTNAKHQNQYFGFGTDNDLEATQDYIIVRHSTFPYEQPQHGSPIDLGGYPLPCTKILGGHRRRRLAFRPSSVVNTSAMSFGSLSGPAIESINRGVRLAGCLQNTGEGGISRYHRHGGELIWQLGTGYFGCRDEYGRFSLTALTERLAVNPQVRALEIKLSQGAKPGLGGFLPGAKVTAEIADARGVSIGRDCISPSVHWAFRNVDELLDFVEHLAGETGLPVGIKAAVSERAFWVELADAMASDARGVDFITIDGGEGGTGAAPLTFSDHVALPFKVGFTEVYRIFAERDLQRQIVFIGSGKLGFPEQALLAMALGCDMVNVGREAMLAIGCIQAQKCHTDHCPSGVASQSAWRNRALVPGLKSVRLSNYIIGLRRELYRLALACREHHPALVPMDRLALVSAGFQTRSPAEVFGYDPLWTLPDPATRQMLEALMRTLRETGGATA